MPRDASKVVTLERGELQDALRRVSQLADQRSHAVKFVLAKEGVEISASSPEYGEAKEAIEKEFKGDPITIDADRRILQLNVAEDEIARRRANWSPPAPRYTRGVLAKYAGQVTSSSTGAVTD